jgi:hypothetical protein
VSSTITNWAVASTMTTSHGDLGLTSSVTAGRAYPTATAG